MSNKTEDNPRTTFDAWGSLQISPMSGKAQGGNFAHSGTAQNQPAKAAKHKDTNNRFGMDNSAAQQIPAGYKATCAK